MIAFGARRGGAGSAFLFLTLWSLALSIVSTNPKKGTVARLGGFAFSRKKINGFYVQRSLNAFMHVCEIMTWDGRLSDWQLVALRRSTCGFILEKGQLEKKGSAW